MSEPTAPAMTTADLERRVRSALATRLRNGRVADHPEWDDECVTAIMAAFDGSAEGPAIIAELAGDGTVRVSNWTFPKSGDGLSLPAQQWADFVAGVKAGSYDDMVTVPGSATATKAAAAPKLPSRRAKAAAQS
jgi:hypothetical protein